MRSHRSSSRPLWFLPLALAWACVVSPAAWACAEPDAGGLDAEKLLAEGYALDRQGQYQRALELFRFVTERQPGHRKAHYYMANTLWRAEAITDARREWEVVMRLGPKDRLVQEGQAWLKANGPRAQAPTVTTLDAPGLVSPVALALAPTGDLFVSDPGARRIWKLSAEGAFTALVGQGGEGHADGPAAEAGLTAPGALALDPAGNLYFVDGNRIRFLTPDGRVGTLMGDLEAASRDGDWKTARLDRPTAIACDAGGNVYVAEGQAPAIRRVSPDGTTRLLAGGRLAGQADGPPDAAQFREIAALRVDAEGTLWVLDWANRICKLGADGVVRTLPGCAKSGYQDGPAALAHYARLAGLAVGHAGALYLADAGNHSIRVVEKREQDAGLRVRTLAGGFTDGASDGSGILASFQEPTSLVAGKEQLYVLDRKARLIRRIRLD